MEHALVAGLARAQRTRAISATAMEGAFMKALAQSGLVLVFGLFVARSFAEEIQWRRTGASSPKPADGNARVATPAPASAGLNLGQPVPIGTPASPASDIQPVTFRPAATIFRAKTDAPRPLPSGPELVPSIQKTEEPPRGD